MKHDLPSLNPDYLFDVTLCSLKSWFYYYVFFLLALLIYYSAFVIKCNRFLEAAHFWVFWKLKIMVNWVVLSIFKELKRLPSLSDFLFFSKSFNLSPLSHVHIKLNIAGLSMLQPWRIFVQARQSSTKIYSTFAVHGLGCSFGSRLPQLIVLLKSTVWRIRFDFPALPYQFFSQMLWSLSIILHILK